MDWDRMSGFTRFMMQMMGEAVSAAERYSEKSSEQEGLGDGVERVYMSEEELNEIPVVNFTEVL